MKKSERNPTWSRDELILALNLYLLNRTSPPSKNSAEVTKLSKLLNLLHEICGIATQETLRNENGVYLKMMNFRSLDPIFIRDGKVGMTNRGKLEELVWNEFYNFPEKLADEAIKIEQTILNYKENKDFNNQSSTLESEEGEEGGVIIQLHKIYERDKKLVKAKKYNAKVRGELWCEVCGFDFFSNYGELGAGYIEVHHLIPVHTIKNMQKTKMSDLALLCSNCHRMAHRKKYPLTLDELKDSLKSPHRINKLESP